MPGTLFFIWTPSTNADISSRYHAYPQETLNTFTSTFIVIWMPQIEWPTFDRVARLWYIVSCCPSSEPTEVSFESWGGSRLVLTAALAAATSSTGRAQFWKQSCVPHHTALQMTKLSLRLLKIYNYANIRPADVAGNMSRSRQLKKVYNNSYYIIFWRHWNHRDKHWGRSTAKEIGKFRFLTCHGNPPHYEKHALLLGYLS